MNTTYRVLGLDASTSTVGIAVVDYCLTNKIFSLIHYEAFKPPKATKVGELERLAVVKRKVLDTIKEYKPDEIAIEDFTRFMKGKSGASTIIPLAILNRTVCLSIYELLNVVPTILNVNTIRASIKINKSRPSKQDMPDVVSHHLGIEFPWKFKINKKTKLQEIVEENYDIADAMSCAICAIWLKHVKPKKKSKTKKIKNKKSKK